MVACEIREDASGEAQSGYAVLGCCMGGDLHEGVIAALLHHLGQQSVELQGVGRGVGGLYAALMDIVADGREQPGLIALEFGHFVEQGGGGGLAVGAGDAHKLQLLAGASVPFAGELAERHGAVGYLDICDAALKRRREFLAYDSSDMGRCHHRDIFMAVGGHAFDGDKHAVFLCPARIALQRCYVFVCLSYDLERLYGLQKGLQFECHIVGSCCIFRFLMSGLRCCPCASGCLERHSEPLPCRSPAGGR